MFFRQLLNDETACASCLFGCKSKSKFAVVDPHVDLVVPADAVGFGGAIGLVAGLTAASGLWVALDLDVAAAALSDRGATPVDSAVVGHG